MIIPDCLEAPSTWADALRTTKTDIVCEYLREAIITGQLKPGERIGQQELAESLHVSPTPVREALHKLDAQGILSYESHHGAQVALHNFKTINEIYLVRATLEGLAIEEAVSYIDKQKLACLEELATVYLPNILGDCLESGNFIPFRKANYNFHKSIYSSSRMAVIPELIDILWSRSVIPDDLYIFDALRIQDACSEHILIVQKMRERNSIEAKSMLQEHVELNRRSYLRYLSEEIQQPDISSV